MAMAKFAILLCILLLTHPVLSNDLPHPKSAARDPEDISFDFLKVNEEDIGNGDVKGAMGADETEHQLTSLQNANELDEELFGAISTIMGIIPAVTSAVKGIGGLVSGFVNRRRRKSRRSNARRGGQFRRGMHRYPSYQHQQRRPYYHHHHYHGRK